MEKETCPFCGATAETQKNQWGDVTVALDTGCVHVFTDGPRFGFVRPIGGKEEGEDDHA